MPLFGPETNAGLWWVGNVCRSTHMHKIHIPNRKNDQRTRTFASRPPLNLCPPAGPACSPRNSTYQGRCGAMLTCTIARRHQRLGLGEALYLNSTTFYTIIINNEHLMYVVVYSVQRCTFYAHTQSH